MSRQTPQSILRTDALPLAALDGRPVGPRSYRVASLIRSSLQRPRGAELREIRESMDEGMLVHVHVLA
jgi:hypothetical protein